MAQPTFTGRIRSAFNALFAQPETPAQEITRARKQAFYDAGYGYNSGNVFGVTYDGEKNLGEIGPAKHYIIDYDTMRARSWQSYLDSEITQMVFKKYGRWLIGAGLTMQCCPNTTVLNAEGIELEAENFNEIAEAYWHVWANSDDADYAGMETLHQLAYTGYINAAIGGDVLVVLRVNNQNQITVQLIDGAHIQSPGFGTDQWAQTAKNGNIIRHGVEMDKNGQHIAYYVRNSDLSYTRIEARSASTGLRMAYMVYGLKYRLDNTRGLPIVAAVLETVKKLERYKEATVGKAEEENKTVFQVTHQQYSTGENIFAGKGGANLARAAMDAGAKESHDDPRTTEGERLASKVYATTQKQAYNMPVGSKLEAVKSSNGQLVFKEFYTTNIDIVCATTGIPPNVAMGIYNDSFSASRAATKDWEHTLKVGRADFKNQFYKHIYALFLHLHVLTNKVSAPGYLQANLTGNKTVLAAYRQCHFMGDMFPHIDPLKEAKAEREKLGPLAANIPLTTVENAVEALGGANSDSIIEQFAKEREHAAEYGLPLDAPATGTMQQQPPQPEPEEGEDTTEETDSEEKGS